MRYRLEPFFDIHHWLLLGCHQFCKQNAGMPYQFDNAKSRYFSWCFPACDNHTMKYRRGVCRLGGWMLRTPASHRTGASNWQFIDGVGGNQLAKKSGRVTRKGRGKVHVSWAAGETRVSREFSLGKSLQKGLVDIWWVLPCPWKSFGYNSTEATWSHANFGIWCYPFSHCYRISEDGARFFWVQLSNNGLPYNSVVRRPVLLNRRELVSNIWMLTRCLHCI